MQENCLTKIFPGSIILNSFLTVIYSVILENFPMICGNCGVISCCKRAVITKGFLSFLFGAGDSVACQRAGLNMHDTMVYCCRVVRGNQPNGSVRNRSVRNLSKMHAIRRRSTLSLRPLIKRDIEEHMLGKSRRGRGVVCQQYAGIWFLQAGLRKAKVTPQIRFAVMNFWGPINNQIKLPSSSWPATVSLMLRNTTKNCDKT